VSVTRKNPHIEDVNYVHAAHYYDGRDAAAAVRYLVRRPGNKMDPRGGWHSIPRSHRLGNAEAFKAAADERTALIWEDARKRGKTLIKNRALWCASYLHILLSPQNREELSTEELKTLARYWTVDGNGEELLHFGAVHTDGRRGKHLHLLVARDKIDRRELRELKSRTDALAIRLERGRTPERERVPERHREQTIEYER
jgi:hypothetical protein